MVEKFIRTVNVYNNKTKQYQDVTVAIDIDFDYLATHLGQQAIRNKSQMSRYMGGHIVGRIREVHVPAKPLTKEWVENVS